MQDAEGARTQRRERRGLDIWISWLLPSSAIELQGQRHFTTSEDNSSTVKSVGSKDCFGFAKRASRSIASKEKERASLPIRGQQASVSPSSHRPTPPQPRRANDADEERFEP